MEVKLAALPDENAKVPVEEHVEQVCGVVGHVEAKALSYNDVPAGAVDPVHRLIDCSAGHLKLDWKLGILGNARVNTHVE